MSILEPPVREPRAEQRRGDHKQPRAGGRTRSELRGEAADMAELAAGLLCTAGAEEEPTPEPRRVIAWRETEELGVGQGQEKMTGKSSRTNAGKI